MLASGWHSAQPKKQACVPGAKDTLVFLTPGVEKFSRGLVKGKNYFGSEPELLEPHTEDDEGEKEEEDGSIEEISDRSSNQLVKIHGPDSVKPVKKVKNLKTFYDDQRERNPVNIQLSQKHKRNDLDTSTSVRKRYRTVASCSEGIGSGRSTIPSVPEIGHHANVCSSNIHDRNNKSFTPLTRFIQREDGNQFTTRKPLLEPRRFSR